MSNQSVCPWWLGYLLANPLRKLIQDPNLVVGPYLKPGLRALDYGSGMGYFTLPMAKSVGSKGKVYCFDVQEKMLSKLVCKARKEGLESIIEPRIVSDNNNPFTDLKQSIDFALLFAVAHEVPDREQLFKNLAFVMKTGGKLLFSEPKGHVSQKDFDGSVLFAEMAGFVKKEPLIISKGLSVLLVKK